MKKKRKLLKNLKGKNRPIKQKTQSIIDSTDEYIHLSEPNASSGLFSVCEELPIREVPNLASKTLGMISANEPFELLGVKKTFIGTTFFHINLDGIIGYITDPGMLILCNKKNE